MNDILNFSWNIYYYDACILAKCDHFIQPEVTSFFLYYFVKENIYIKKFKTPFTYFLLKSRYLTCKQCNILLLKFMYNY